MSHAKDPITGLTAKEEHFARLIAFDTLNQSEAYRQAFAPPGSSPSTIAENASHLVTKLQPRIQQLKGAQEAGLITDKQNSAKKLIANLEALAYADIPLSRLRPADKIAALDKLAKVLGLYRDQEDDARSRPAPITQITVVLSHGERQTVETGRVVEQAARDQLSELAVEEAEER